MGKCSSCKLEGECLGVIEQERVSLLKWKEGPVPTFFLLRGAQTTADKSVSNSIQQEAFCPLHPWPAFWIEYNEEKGGKAATSW